MQDSPGFCGWFGAGQSILAQFYELPSAKKLTGGTQCFRMSLKLAVDNEQYTGNQRTDTRDDVEDPTKAYAKQAQAGDDQKDSE
jgi:hypothetical protein